MKPGVTQGGALPTRLHRLAERLGGEVVGGDPLVRGVAALSDASPSDLAPLTHPRYAPEARATRAAAIVCPPALSAAAARSGRPIWLHAQPWIALAVLLSRLDRPVRGRRRIHPTARIGRGAVVEAGAVIGPGSVVGPNAVICAGAALGRDCVVGPNAVVGPRTSLGDRVRLGPGAVVGSEGFGWATTSTGIVRIPHVGRVVIEDDVWIGANANVARSTLGTTRIGRGAKIDALVQIGHNAVVGEGSLLAAQVGIAGSSRLGRGVQAGGQAGVADHLVIGDGARLAAQSGVIGDVAPGVAVAGYPARPRMRWLREQAVLARLAKERKKRRERR